MISHAHVDPDPGILKVFYNIARLVILYFIHSRSADDATEYSTAAMGYSVLLAVSSVVLDSVGNWNFVKKTSGRG